MSSQSSDVSKAVLARAISRAERGLYPSAQAWFPALSPNAPSKVIGITGPPGVGKSTLISGLLDCARQVHPRVAVVAVDPSSPLTGGAMLGDRIRMNTHAVDDGVFIRSMGSRGRTDGVGPSVWEACRLLLSAGYDPVILETVGVGQAECGLLGLCDVRMLVLSPLTGDDVQASKAGVIEMVDLVVVNKGDLPGAASFVRQIRQALRRSTASESADIPVVEAQALDGRAGVEDVWRTIDAVWERICAKGLVERRTEATAQELAGRAVAHASAALRSPAGRQQTLEVAKRVLAEETGMEDAISQLLASLPGLESSR